MCGMGLALVPAGADWLGDVRLKDSILANVKARIEQAVKETTMVREFRDASNNIRVHDVGGALEVTVDGEAVGLEKGVPAHQMVNQEGSVIPIKTVDGIAFRKVTRLSLMMGKWRSKGLPARGAVKGAIQKAMSGLAEATREAEDQLAGGNTPRVRDILGVR